MKYSEFKSKVEEFGLTVKQDEYYVEVKSSGYNVLSVSKVRWFEFDNGHACFSGLGVETKQKLYEFAYQLAKTPLAEREEEKRYYLRLSNTTLTDRDDYYLNLIKRNKGDYYYLDDTDEVFGAKTIFTESEISQMDITGFEKVEVTP